jgi:mRNA interferase RelE/StbE
MPYTARFSKAFLKKEKRLPSEVKSRIVETLKETLMKPDNGTMLVGPLKGLWKVRVGKYRIVYEIDEQGKRVVFLDVELRVKVYGNFLLSTTL